MKDKYLKDQVSRAIKTAMNTYHDCRENGTGGTALPGIKAAEICPDILKLTSENVRTILVSGTNGKTTTVRLLSALLDFSGIDSFSNKEGANIECGITTTFVLNIDEKGRPVRKTAVIECDELYVPKMIEKIDPEVVIFLPITRDQVDRLGEPLDVAAVFNKALACSNAVLCIEKNCEYLSNIANAYTNNRIIRYEGLDCKCMIDDDRYDIQLPATCDCNFCNAAAALAGIKAYGLRPERCLAAFETFRMPFGREEHFQVNGKDTVITIAKNTISAQNAFKYLESLHEKYQVVIGVNSAIEDGTDVSWATGFAYEKYRNFLKEAVVTGDASRTVAKVLKKAGTEARIINSPEEIVRYTENCSYSVFMILNYTCMMKVRSAFWKAGYLQPFWE